MSNIVSFDLDKLENDALILQQEILKKQSEYNDLLTFINKAKEYSDISFVSSIIFAEKNIEESAVQRIVLGGYRRKIDRSLRGAGEDHEDDENTEIGAVQRSHGDDDIHPEYNTNINLKNKFNGLSIEEICEILAKENNGFLDSHELKLDFIRAGRYTNMAKAKAISARLSPLKKFRSVKTEDGRYGYQYIQEPPPLPFT
jgi:hypothetical protein